MRINSTGDVGIGTTTMTGKLNVTAPSVATAANAYGLYLDGAQSTANTAAYYGIYSVPTYTAASGNTLNGMSGIKSNPQNTGTGTVSTMIATEGLPQNTSSGVVTNMYGAIGTPQKTGTGAVTSIYGLYARCDNTNATGAVTNCYGLYLETPVTTGAITNQYGVYQAGASVDNYFQGNVGIGTATPQSRLDVSGGLSVGTYAGVTAAPSNGMNLSGSLYMGQGSAQSNLYNSYTGAYTFAPKLQISGVTADASGMALMSFQSNAAGPNLVFGMRAAASLVRRASFKPAAKWACLISRQATVLIFSQHREFPRSFRARRQQVTSPLNLNFIPGLPEEGYRNVR